MRLSPRATGIAAAVVTVAIWTGFIVIGRASAGRTLLPFDIPCGTSDTREQLEAGVKTEEIARSWEPSVSAFNTLRKTFLLY